MRSCITLTPKSHYQLFPVLPINISTHTISDEGVINETEEEHREVIAKLGKLREFVETLDYKDKELEKFCRERFSIIADIMQVYDYADVLQNVSSLYTNTVVEHSR